MSDINSNNDPLSPDDFQFNHINRNSNWGAIFDLLDANFDKVAEYFATLGNRVKVEKFTANAGQTVFQLKDDYNTRRNCVSVYLNGARQWLDTGFTETSESSITMTTPCEAGDEVVIVYNKHFILPDSRSNTQSGTTEEIVIDTNTVIEKVIKFNTNYNEVPVVVCGLQTTTNNQKVGGVTCVVTDVSQSEFKVRICNSTSLSFNANVNWIASGKS